jgi:hypothetical protein
MNHISYIVGEDEWENRNQRMRKEGNYKALNNVALRRLE